MITSTNKPLHNTTIMPTFIWQSLLKTIILIFTIFVTNDLSAQGVKMSVNYIAPEWNGTKVCDGGGGYNPTPITAPSISYSSSDVNAIKEGKYDYTWKQKINNEEWQTVSSGKSVNFIPAFNPPLLFNAPSGSALKTFSYQLIIPLLIKIFKFYLFLSCSLSYICDIHLIPWQFTNAISSLKRKTTWPILPMQSVTRHE